MEQNRQLTTAGLNIQFPWSELILSGTKIVETRGYPLPKKFVGKTLAIIETGRSVDNRQTKSAMIVGLVRFSSSFQYKNLAEWKEDFKRHQVLPEDPKFSFKRGNPKWGWEISHVCRVSPAIAPPKVRGIKYAKKCLVPMESLNVSRAKKLLFLAHCIVPMQLS